MKDLVVRFRQKRDSTGILFALDKIFLEEPKKKSKKKQTRGKWL